MMEKVGAGLLILLCFMCLTGCYGREARPSGPILYYQDAAVPDKGKGLDFKVLNFRWRYIQPTDQINVVGVAENMSDEGHHGVRLIANAQDQYGQPLGTVDCYLNPTYVGPHNQARFDFYINKGEWVEAIYLKYLFEKRY